MKNKNHIRSLCECGVFIAAAIALSFAELDLWLQGGSISLTMIPIVIMAVRWGPVWGVVTGLVFGTLKCLIGGHMEWGFISVMLDYTLAYGAVGLAGVFKRRERGAVCGVILGAFCRFIIHFISGVTIYAITMPTELYGNMYSNAAIYSVVYNGAYMLINCVIAVIILGILTKPLKKYLTGADLK
ncbi:MAG: energy-coupled thiamine transporter ThiT [Oscillospiraceae bacterium]|nr:energy-coupled thiamine transporter ThiT [Oscillospiraceae bacterium]